MTRATEKHPLVQAVDAAVDRGISPTEFRQIAESVVDQIEAKEQAMFGKRFNAQRAARAALKNPKAQEGVDFITTKTERGWVFRRMKPTPAARIGTGQKKVAKAKPTGDKNEKLMKMLAGSGSTVEQLTSALGWLPHTLRARLSHLNKPKSKGGEGAPLIRERINGVTSYRLA